MRLRIRDGVRGAGSDRVAPGDGIPRQAEQLLDAHGVVVPSPEAPPMQTGLLAVALMALVLLRPIWAGAFR